MLLKIKLSPKKLVFLTGWQTLMYHFETCNIKIFSVVCSVYGSKVQLQHFILLRHNTFNKSVRNKMKIPTTFSFQTSVH
jgi:hypothetical protein